jgi:ssDNA-binding Zn-finger/Zn-ribbon topoisomerase 1
MSPEEEARLAFAKTLIDPLMPKWGKAPEAARCTQCGAGNLERSFIQVGGPFSGSVRCPSCGHVESVASHVGKTCFSVEPLPETT